MARKPITSANPYTPQRGQFAGETFYSERQYRNALARTHGYQSLHGQQSAAKPIGRGRDLDRLRPSEREARGKVLKALSLMRNDSLSVGRAAREVGTTPNAIRRYAGTALEKDARGRYTAKHFDRLARSMTFYTDRGRITLDVRDSRCASRIGKYMNAVDHYLTTGDECPLRAFRGQSVRVDKLTYPFITDIGVLDTLAGAGELRFDSLYRLAV